MYIYIYLLFIIVVIGIIIVYTYEDNKLDETYADNKLDKTYADNMLDKTFYTIDETYPILNNINFDLLLNDLNNVKNMNWKEWPEFDLLKNKENTQNSKWTVFPIKSFGKWSNKYIKLCPYIYNIFKNNDDIINIGFSRLTPNTVLNKHQGWANLSNYILRCHLALTVPGAAYIYCENDKQQHIPGKWIIFDDSKIHYADNLGNDDRIVLIVDIIRPNNVKKGISNIKDSDELITFIKEFQE